MNLESLVLIKDDDLAQRLIVTWPRVGQAYGRAREAGDAEALADVRERWSAISGVDVDDIPKVEPLLFDNGFIGPDGLVDDKAAAFIRGRVAVLIRPPQQQGQRRRS